MMLELKGVSTFYGNIQALWDVNLLINQGEIVSLIGANGAGKSTTLMSICGAISVRSGEILLDGLPIQNQKPDHTVRMGISQVPEGRLIFPDMTVLENLELGAYLRRDKNEIKKDIDNLFEHFPILAQRRQQAGGTLSGGEQQMLSISRALMAKPRLLLLDEPSLGLAPLLIKEVFDLIRRIRDMGTSVLLVEQNARMALSISDRAYVLDTGSIVLNDNADALLESEAIRKAYLGG
jgi:branched-chain amino acid transport system ATP-binding protein